MESLHDTDLEDVTVCYHGLEEDVSAQPPIHYRILFSLNRLKSRIKLRHLYIPAIVLPILIIMAVVTTFLVLKSQHHGDIIKSENDNREYKAIKLKNSLRVTLVKDTLSASSACAVAVAAGSFAEPPDRGGLAHFVEHLLFLGSYMYPDENYFMELVETEGDGRTNAYTADEVTDYYFSTKLKEKFKKTISVFSQFFISPLFDMDSVNREISAVESEWKREIGSDEWKSYAMIRLLSSPLHPMHKFSTGSIETLNRTDIQERLWEFYDRYYSANLITVAIVGNETLDTLQDWAEEIFTAIPNKVRQKPVFHTLPFPPGDKRYISRRVYYQPKSDKDSLKLIFPVNIPDYPNLSYITYLLGYEGKGSLFQYLTNRGYITSLMASISVEAQNFIIVSVYTDLTETGLKDPHFIIEALFKFLKRVKVTGISEAMWQENKKIDELKFKFKEKEDPASYASTISANMAKREDPRDYLDPPSRRIYNQTLEEEILGYFTPENFNLYISSLKLNTSDINVYGPQLTQTEKWYSTPYANQPIPQSDIDNWNNVGMDDELTLPEPNIFIPEDFRIVSSEGATTLPVLVNTTRDMTVWWYQDTEFKQPKIYMGCRIQPRQTKPTIKNQLLSEMLSSILSIETSASLYPAVSVDYNMAFGFNEYWVLWLSGFSDPSKVENVIMKGLDALFELNFEINDSHFNATVREPIRKDYLNVKNWMPAQLTRRYSRMLMDKYLFDYPLALEEIDRLSQSDIKALRDNFLNDIAIDCSAMGNLRSEQAAKYSQIIKTKMVTQGKANVVKDNRLADYDHPVYKLPQNKTLVIRKEVENKEEPNSGALVQFQIGPTESNGAYKDRKPYTRNVLVTLLGLMMREPCFNYLRTQQQLGYVASCFDEEYKDILVYNILVQGSRVDAGAEVMASEIDKFIDLQYAIFNNSRNTADGMQLWDDIKVALKKQLEEKPISLSDKNSQFNKEIFSPTRDFERKEKKTAALAELTMDDFLEFYQRYLMSDQRRKISAQVYGKQHIPYSKDVNHTKGEVLVEDIEKYRDDNLRTFFGANE